MSTPRTRLLASLATVSLLCPLAACSGQGSSSAPEVTSTTPASITSTAASTAPAGSDTAGTDTATTAPGSTDSAGSDGTTTASDAAAPAGAHEVTVGDLTLKNVPAVLMEVPSSSSPDSPQVLKDTVTLMTMDVSIMVTLTRLPGSTGSSDVSSLLDNGAMANAGDCAVTGGMSVEGSPVDALVCHSQEDGTYQDAYTVILNHGQSSYMLMVMRNASGQEKLADTPQLVQTLLDGVTWAG